MEEDGEEIDPDNVEELAEEKSEREKDGKTEKGKRKKGEKEMGMLNRREFVALGVGVAALQAISSPEPVRSLKADQYYANDDHGHNQQDQLQFGG